VDAPQPSSDLAHARAAPSSTSGKRWASQDSMTKIRTAVLLLLGFGIFCDWRARLYPGARGVFAGPIPILLPRAALRCASPNLIARKDLGAAQGAGARLLAIGPTYVKLGSFWRPRPDSSAAKSPMRSPPCRTAWSLRARRGGRHRRKSLGKKIDEAFLSFGEPVAACLGGAGAYRLRRYHDGERKVAVKVLRPGVERQFARDLADMYVMRDWSSAFVGRRGCAP